MPWLHRVKLTIHSARAVEGLFHVGLDWLFRLFDFFLGLRYHRRDHGWVLAVVELGVGLAAPSLVSETGGGAAAPVRAAPALVPPQNLHLDLANALLDGRQFIDGDAEALLLLVFFVFGRHRAGRSDFVLVILEALDDKGCPV